MLLKMAIRNVFRHKRRTFITVITMAVGLMFFIFFDSLFVGMDNMLADSLIKYSDSSITIYSLDYDKNKRAYPLNKNINEPARIKEFAESLPDVEGVAYRTKFLGEMVYYGKSRYIIGNVINPEMDARIFEIKQSISLGKYLNDNENEAIIGYMLARQLDIKVGDSITIISRTKYETHNALDFTVVGLVKSTVPDINEAGLFISYKGADKLLDLEGNVTSIHVKVKWKKGEGIPSYSKRVEKVASLLQEKFPDCKIYSFMDIFGDFLLLMKQKRVSSLLIIFLMLIISGVGIVNTILMAVYERIKEIGVLLAMGLKPKEIRKLFLLEGCTIGIIGGIAGIILGFLANFWLIYSGYDLEAIFGGSVSGTDLGMPVWGVIYGQWNPSAFIMSFCFAFVVALISAYIPARYASKLHATDCLRFV
ncbi:MAG: ABC transporter permease [Brevinematia bacterium]